MSLVDRIVRARGSRANPVAGLVVSPADVALGHDDSTFSPLSYGDYLATSNDIYAVVSLRARMLSGLDTRLFRVAADGKRVEQRAGALRSLLNRPNAYWTLRRLIHLTELCLGVWGESFIVMERAGPGRRPRELWWVKPSQMTPVPDPSDYLRAYRYTSPVDGSSVDFMPDEVIWFRYPNPLDEFAPLSPLAAARLAADTASAAMKSNRNLFVQGWQIGGLVTPTNQAIQFSEDQARRLEDKLNDRFRGVDRAHRWGVLRYDAKVQPMGVSPKDAEFLGGLNASFRQVCRAYGTPSALLNDMEHATLANMREFERMLWEHTLAPEAQFISAELQLGLLSLFPGEADLITLDTSTVPALQESEQAVWDRNRGQIEVGALTINEWRERHGLPPVPWGDVWWAPVNKASVDEATDEPTNNPDAPDFPDAAANGKACVSPPSR